MFSTDCIKFLKSTMYNTYVTRREPEKEVGKGERRDIYVW